MTWKRLCDYSNKRTPTTQAVNLLSCVRIGKQVYDPESCNSVCDMSGVRENLLGKTYRELSPQGFSGTKASRRPVSGKLEEGNMSVVGNVAIDLT
jgi:hypothetical protein